MRCWEEPGATLLARRNKTLSYAVGSPKSADDLALPIRGRSFTTDASVEYPFGPVASFGFVAGREADRRELGTLIDERRRTGDARALTRQVRADDHFGIGDAFGSKGPDSWIGQENRGARGGIE